MKKIVLLVLAIISILLSQAQSKNGAKKYPSLFWEITGNGLSKPSYLFGTMHVSSKIVFHLPDSFYLAIGSVDVVALETNPESWQEDLVKYDLGDNASYSRSKFPWSSFHQIPDDFLNIRSLQFDSYEKQIEAALYSRPSTINNLLYRNYSDYSSDFEEDTYLDMYIYQVGKKMGKRVAGVEKYEESMKLMMEAYRDAAKEKDHKQKSYDNSEDYSADRLQEAYRAGNLDLLDSINKLNSFSDAFDEKFLYSRNLLQATSIDSILRSKTSLFVGVGAAHLPGNRGVIEILRKKGYKLRPIYMGERDSHQKDRVEKLRVPVIFNTQTSDDGFFKVDIPGKLYRFNEDGLLDQLQYADMANGSYYMVTRIKTNSSLWGQSDETVKRKIDSMLYENIPGKILSKQEIMRNGYRGLDILNRTRRGDLQRYNIFITPYEAIIFKMSGNGDYVRDGNESRRFFGSIQLKTYDRASPAWINYQPSYGGFTVRLPHEPFVSKEGNWEFEAQDKTTGNSYVILRTDVHNYGFAEEDTFDLDLLDESFSNSEFIAKEVHRNFTTCTGYPALDCKYVHKDGSVLLARFVIQGPHYYAIITRGDHEDADMEVFLSSFKIQPLIYRGAFERKDTSLSYSVNTTFYPQSKRIKIVIPSGDNHSLYDPDGENEDETDEGNNFFTSGIFKNSVIADDSTGEKIYISEHKNRRYYYNNDSSALTESRVTRNGSWIIRHKKHYQLPGNWKVLELQLSDTNSSRLIWTKNFYRNGVSFFLATEGDTLTAASSFVTGFFKTFTPDSGIKGFDPFEKKSAAYFNDFFNKDSVVHKRAVKAVDEVKLDSGDFPRLKEAIQSLNWSCDKYLETKKSLIAKLGDINTKPSSDYLKELYTAQGDTIEVQYAILESLLQQQTKYAFDAFRDIITAEPPVLDLDTKTYDNDVASSRFNLYLTSRVPDKSEDENGSFWDGLYDTLRLARTILPDMLPLLNLDDYKWKMMKLLGRLIDSGLVTSAEYQAYFNKFFMEAKQELKKQTINEKKKLIKIASEKNLKDDGDADEDDTDNNAGNEKLMLYAKLLLPFWDGNGGVPVLFRQLLQSNDKKLKYNAMLLMIQNGKTVPDSLLAYFAALGEYRYVLYDDLSDADKLKLFPAKYNNQASLATSRLWVSKPYDKPDSVAYLDKLPASFHGTRGYVYFFKYKEKKDDPVWKLATVGLVSMDPTQFEIKDSSSMAPGFNDDDQFADEDPYDFTSFTDARLTDTEPVLMQLSKQLKKMLCSRRNSAHEFYDISKNNADDVSGLRVSN